jgi:thiamine biosynthesis protein ThiI
MPPTPVSAAPPHDPETRVYLLRLSGEVTIKAPRTRARFAKRLARNLATGLADAGVEARLEREWSRIFVHAREPVPGAAGEVIARTFGLQSYSPAERREWNDLGDLVAAGVELFGDAVEGRSFAVRARRSGDRGEIPLRSKQVEIELGAALLERARRVDLSNPEVTARVEVHAGHAYFFRDKIRGPAGLPLGTESRALSLVSGGFDSAVASWMMLRRGVALDYVFFNLGGTAHELGVLRVMKVIASQWSHGDRPNLYEIDFRPLVLEIQEKVKTHYWQVALKRLMLAAAERLAGQVRGGALVTGEAIGQVSSQTPQNLAAISRPIEMPILRPLLGFNKEEIIDRSKAIGTYELSSAVDEYCAILPRRPATKATARALDEQVAGIDPAIALRAIEERKVVDLRALDPAELGSEELEIDSVPDGARLVDLRSRHAFDAWHAADAEHMDFFDALKGYRHLPKEGTWVFYCEVGLKSAHLAEVMQAEGFRAFHVAGGTREMLRRETEDDPLAASLVSPAFLG